MKRKNQKFPASVEKLEQRNLMAKEIFNCDLYVISTNWNDRVVRDGNRAEAVAI